MEEVTAADRDINSIPQRDSTDIPTAADTASNGDGFQRDGASEINEEDDSAPVIGHDGGVIERPAKRRKVEDNTPRRSASRAVSPPWKSFVADGPTTVFENGMRKSSRVNKVTAPPTPEPVKRTPRPSKTTQTNGTPKTGIKREARNGSGPSSIPKAKAQSTLIKKASTQSLVTPARKSERQRKGPAAATTSPLVSPALPNGSPEASRKRCGRPRRGAQTLTDDIDAEPESNEHDPYASLYGSPDDSNPSMPAPRLRLRLRKPDPPNRHPHHAPPKSQYASLEEWLGQDDPLDGEEALRITEEKAEEEAERRLQIVEAAEHGVLSQTRCSIYAPEAAPEPPPQYGHWDHVVAHTVHFNKLLKEEKAFHRRTAKILAREAYDFWKNKFKRKSQDEIEQEEAERQVTRYKQLVKDVKDAWGLVKVEIDKERVAKWEEEQLQLGHKAMDDMFNQAQEILGGRNVGDGASSLISEDRDFDEESQSGASNNLELPHDDDVMSSSSDSEQENEEDDDANLTAEQLREKYGELPDLPESSSEAEPDSDEENAEDEEGTPAPTPDPELDLVAPDELPENPLVHTNGFHDDDENEDENKPGYIDPATVELDQVDEALLDSDDEDKGSESGSEAWSSNEGSETDGNEQEADESEEDDDESGEEDMGMMGFLAPKDIKKLKEAAKTAVEDEEPDKSAEQTNGRSPSPMDVDEEKPHINGHDSVAEDQEAHVNGDTTEPAPSVEVAEPSAEVAEQPKNAPRSRHSSPPRTEVPFLLRGTLREYQHDGLDWLANLYESDTNGILADEMGLGKTIQTISLLAHLAVRHEIWGPHLVVVPTSVMLNWEMEFKKFLPGFKILTYYGDINERKRKRLGWRNTGKDMYNVVITSYQLILQDAAAFKMRPWRYLVLDEAHNIKNFKSQRWQTMLNLRTERRLLLTGTPLQNNIDELWSLLYFLMPAGFAGEGRIAGLDEFTLALKNPTSQILDQGRQQLDAEAQKIVKRLHEVLRPYLLRRLKSEVEKQMPGKYEHVVYCKLSKRQRQLYDGFMGRASTKEILSSGNYMSIINCLMSLRKVCNHPDLFETRAIVTSMAMPKSVPAEYEIKDLLIRKRLQEGMEDKLVNLDALNLVFARREQAQLGHARRTYKIRATRPLEDLLVECKSRRLKDPVEPGTSLQSTMAAMRKREEVAVQDHLQTCLNLTRARTQFMPIYGKDIIDALTVDWHDYTFGGITEGKKIPKPVPYRPHHTPYPTYHGFGQAQMLPKQEEAVQYDIVKRRRGVLGFRSPRSDGVISQWHDQQITHFYDMIPTLEQRAEAFEPLITRFTCVTPAVAAEELAPLTLSKRGVDLIRTSELVHQPDPFHASRIRQSIAFPDKRLLQYDCGKLQRLATLLRDLQAGGHRALIFTQMTKVLDILEQFLNIHGYRYLRLDGSTKIEQRQILTDRFNTDPRILCFILSSRSGGLGINLTGADSVIFYDLDWNPAMDKQCQDRAHRIGQTRDVHIYKFVSEYTIEANILRKSNQKRLLDDVIIQRGDFTTDTFNRVTWRDALDENMGIDTTDEAGAAMERVLGEKIGLLGDARVMGSVEDTEDRTAASIAQKEIVDEIQVDEVDFNESLNATRAASEAAAAAKENEDLDMDGNEKERRHVDEYMLSLYREEYGKEPYRPPTDRQKRNRKGQDPHVRHRKKKY
ncbi:helicase swr1 [Pyrenophora tritici-repentis]|uniref:DNA helicase n=1 Tax=Pyrenophora tritici-repentis (strain Pt-1C-BFP) TaxID=426418 RepID=B2W595_PYRTR|nr:helicase swr1 [Pyrenophora tritici-repentis Pt-1C-BFP]EDU47702.1 helicase swr1 [Pyrenophora tritici-repentis Pt-1C-BFP]KAA8612428.1 helicase swr1 [Pyrenophora tritici-repentis]KAF7447045.1 helicase swr1 [Pyrenophora tritici-repentis]